MTRPTAELAKEYFPDVKVRASGERTWSGYSCQKAREMLDFTARYLLTD
jgi:hypothetical protein